MMGELGPLAEQLVAVVSVPMTWERCGDHNGGNGIGRPNRVVAVAPALSNSGASARPPGSRDDGGADGMCRRSHHNTRLKITAGEEDSLEQAADALDHERDAVRGRGPAHSAWRAVVNSAVRNALVFSRCRVGVQVQRKDPQAARHRRRVGRRTILSTGDEARRNPWGARSRSGR